MNEEKEHEETTESTRPDPISIAFDGPPGPSIVREGHELPSERKLSGGLGTSLLIGLIFVLLFAYGISWLARKFF